MQLKALTAADKLLFIKSSRSTTGDLHHKFIKTGRCFCNFKGLKLLSEI